MPWVKVELEGLRRRSRNLFLPKVDDEHFCGEESSSLRTFR